MPINSPLPVSLPEESKKAAKILRSFVDSHNNGLDRVIPRSVLERAHGFAIFTVFKAGFLVSARAGSGLVIARTPDGSWSPPSAIGLGGFGFGGQAGAEVTDFLIVLNNRAAVASFMSAGSLTLGGNMSIAVGPLGRNAEGSGAVNTKGKIAAMYSYSKTKGLFGGVSVEGSILVERQDANRLAYGGNPTAKQILSGTFDPPEWTMNLIHQLDICTGLPGGQTWRDRDEDGEGGGMGWNSPTKEKGDPMGYVFGEGVNAGGNTPPRRSRAGTGNSIFSGITGGGAEGTRSRSGSLGDPKAAKRSGSFNPFSSGTKSPNKGGNSGPMSSSETYNAGLTWDSSGPLEYPGNRSRAGSGARRPYDFDTDSLGKEDIWSNGLGKSSRERKDSKSTPPLPSDDVFSDSHGSRGGDDLNGHAIHASFAKLKLANDEKMSRSRSNSRTKSPNHFNDIQEDEYTPFETTSSFATRSKLTKPPLMANRSSSHQGYSTMDITDEISMDVSPFGEGTIGSGRAFETYTGRPPSTRSLSDGPKPQLALKKGLERTDDGYARAVGLFEFKAADKGDLPLQKGNVVIVLDSVGNGEWWKGRDPNSGREGIFPNNYVEVLDIPQSLRGGVSRGQLKKRVITTSFE